LEPRRFGGYEFDLKTYYRVVMELSRADPSTGWGVCLAAGHALMLGSYFEEQAQADGFGPDGDFRAPSVAAPMGTATPVDGGWVVEGKWPYASGAPYATHFLPRVAIPAKKPKDMRFWIALVPRSQWTMLDDWGDILGMRGSGSNSIVVEHALIPHSHVAQVDMLDVDLTRGTPGLRLHGNPLYGGRGLGFFHGELISIMVGAGRAALDEYEEIIRTKDTIFPPFTPRYLNHDHQRAFGLALGMIDAAEAVALQRAEMYMEYCRRGAGGGEPFTLDEDFRLFASLEHAGRLVWEAVELLFRTASSSAAKNGQRMQRYYRDLSIYRGHLSAQFETIAQTVARVNLGLQQTMADVP
jgi:3-hydroxy-9,10-secoandrosta-1,3,5(10)-triene-9,17-dione monooxygenase